MAGWSLSIVDAARPPQYQARILISADRRAHDYVFHWLDQFGAAGARVVGIGTRDKTVLNATFPYAEGAFRNTWEYHPADRTWTLVIDGQRKDGTWYRFADYKMSRATLRSHSGCAPDARKSLR